MNLYKDHILPKLLHRSMRQEILLSFRERIASKAVGTVLEIGVGSGLKLPHYAAGAHSIVGLEPSAEMLRMASERAAQARVPVEFLEPKAEAIPLNDRSIDTLVLTWTLCTIGDARRALTEMRRVLRPGGRLLFVEHGRSTSKGVSCWQDRLAPLWNRIAGGCHLNRKIDDLITDGGFRIDSLSHAQLPGPRTHTFFYEGSAWFE